MTRQEFVELLENNILLLDGATGTELYKRGMPGGACTPEWVLDNPDALIDVQKSYIDAGSDIIYAPTFGANKYSLKESRLSGDIKGTNEKLLALSKQAAEGTDVLVAADISPTGKMLAPLGDLSFDDCVLAFKEQVSGLLDADLFVIETMLDIKEVRAAVIAIRELSDKPIIVSMTFEKNGRTLTGTDPVTALITLQSMGVLAVGSNCSVGPKAMLETLAQMRPHAIVPLMAKPNVGVPHVDTCDCDDEDEIVTAETFGEYANDFINIGVRLFGGCCGSDPEYIKEAKKALWQTEGFLPENTEVNAVSSARKTVFLTDNVKMSPEIDMSDPDAMYTAQDMQYDYDIISFVIPDNFSSAQNSLSDITSIVTAPLCLKSNSNENLEKVLRLYDGRAMVLADDNQHDICEKYGAFVI